METANMDLCKRAMFLCCMLVVSVHGSSSGLVSSNLLASLDDSTIVSSTLIDTVTTPTSSSFFTPTTTVTTPGLTLLWSSEMESTGSDAAWSAVSTSPLVIESSSGSVVMTTSGQDLSMLMSDMTTLHSSSTLSGTAEVSSDASLPLEMSSPGFLTTTISSSPLNTAPASETSMLSVTPTMSSWVSTDFNFLTSSLTSELSTSLTTQAHPMSTMESSTLSSAPAVSANLPTSLMTSSSRIVWTPMVSHVSTNVSESLQSSSEVSLNMVPTSVMTSWHSMVSSEMMTTYSSLISSDTTFHLSSDITFYPSLITSDMTAHSSLTSEMVTHFSLMTSHSSLVAYDTATYSFLMSSDIALMSSYMTPLHSLMTTHTGLISSDMTADPTSSYLTLPATVPRTHSSLLSSDMTAELSLMPSVMTTDPSLMSYVMTTVPSLMSSVMTTDPSLMSYVMTTDPSLMPSVMTTDPNLMSSDITTDPGLMSSVMTTDSSLMPNVMTTDPSLMPSIMTTDPNLMSSDITTDPGMMSAVMTTDPSMMPSVMTTDLSLMPSVMTTDPNLMSSDITTDPGMMSSVMTTDPSLMQSVMTTDPSLMSSDMTTDPGMMSSVMTTDPSLMPSVMTTDPNLMSSDITTDPGLMSPVMTTDSSLMPSVMTTDPSLMPSVMTTDPNLMSSDITTDPGMMSSIMTTDPNLMPPDITTDPGLMSSVMTADPSLMQSVMTTDPSLMSSDMTTDPGMMSSVMTTDPSLMPSVMTTNLSLMSSVVDTDPNLMSSVVTTDPSLMSSDMTTDHGLMSSVMNTDPTLMSFVMTTDPSLMPSVMTTDPSMMPSDMTTDPGMMSSVMTTDPSRMPSVMTTDPSMMPSDMTTDPGMMSSVMTTDPSRMPSVMTTDPSMMPSDMTTDPGMISSVMTIDPSRMPSVMTIDPSLISSAMTTHPSLILSAMTTDPSLILSDMTADHGMMSPVMTTDYSLMPSDMTTDPSLMSSDMTTDPGMMSSVMTIDPSRMPSVMTTDPKLMSSAMTTDPNLMSSDMTTEPGLMSSVMTTDPSLISSVTTTDPSLMSSDMTADHGLMSSVVTTDPSLMSSVMTTDPGLTSSVMTTDPSMMSYVMTAYPTFISSVMTADPSLLSAHTTQHFSLLSSYRTAHFNLMSSDMTPDFSLISSVMTAYPSLVSNVMTTDPSLMPSVITTVANLMSSVIATDPSLMAPDMTTDPTLMSSVMTTDPGLMSFAMTTDPSTIISHMAQHSSLMSHMTADPLTAHFSLMSSFMTTDLSLMPTSMTQHPGLMSSYMAADPMTAHFSLMPSVMTADPSLMSSYVTTDPNLMSFVMSTDPIPTSSHIAQQPSLVSYMTADPMTAHFSLMSSVMTTDLSLVSYMTIDPVLMSSYMAHPSLMSSDTVSDMATDSSLMPSYMTSETTASVKTTDPMTTHVSLMSSVGNTDLSLMSLVTTTDTNLMATHSSLMPSDMISQLSQLAMSSEMTANTSLTSDMSLDHSIKSSYMAPDPSLKTAYSSLMSSDMSDITSVSLPPIMTPNMSSDLTPHLTSESSDTAVQLSLTTTEMRTQDHQMSFTVTPVTRFWSSATRETAVSETTQTILTPYHMTMAGDLSATISVEQSLVAPSMMTSSDMTPLINQMTTQPGLLSTPESVTPTASDALSQLPLTSDVTTQTSVMESATSAHSHHESLTSSTVTSEMSSAATSSSWEFSQSSVLISSRSSSVSPSFQTLTSTVSSYSARWMPSETTTVSTLLTVASSSQTSLVLPVSSSLSSTLSVNMTPELYTASSEVPTSITSTSAMPIQPGSSEQTSATTRIPTLSTVDLQVVQTLTTVGVSLTSSAMTSDLTTSSSLPLSLFSGVSTTYGTAAVPTNIAVVTSLQQSTNDISSPSGDVTVTESSSLSETSRSISLLPTPTSVLDTTPLPVTSSISVPTEYTSLPSSVTAAGFSTIQDSLLTSFVVASSQLVTTETPVLTSTAFAADSSSLIDQATLLVPTSTFDISASSTVATPTIDTTVLADCYRNFTSSAVESVFSLMELATCAGNIVSYLGGNLTTVSFPQVPVLDNIPAFFTGGSSPWVSTLSGFGKPFVCTGHDFVNYTETAVLYTVSTAMLTGVPVLKTNLDASESFSRACVTSGVDAAIRQQFVSELTTVFESATNITTMLKDYTDAVLDVIKRVTGCPGASDCNGDCGGRARFDPVCRVCYGGRTTHRVSDPRDLKDCNGDCLGTAVVEPCRQTCTGGNTGPRASDYLDCAGVCNGTNVRDTCGRCVSRTTAAAYTNGSKYMDCTNKCFVRANMTRMAIVNTCGQCVLGDTGRPRDFGMDVCGVCGGNDSTCTDCDGVPNGGKVQDACGVCGGDGTSCVAVVTATPALLPSGASKTLSVSGAGLRSVECVAERNSATTTLSVSSAGNTQITLTVPSSLAPGDYKVKCGPAGGALANTSAPFTLYDSSAATVTAASKSSFTMVQGSNETVVFTGTGFVDNSTYCKITDGSGNVRMTAATVTSQTSASCTLNHPSSSARYTVQLSFNQVDMVGQSFTVTANAAAPTVSAKFSNDGGKVLVSFSPGAAITRSMGCNDVFDNAAATFGASAICKIVSPRLVVVMDASGVSTGTTITLKTNAVKAHRESFSLAATGSVTVAAADNPITPTIRLKGPTQISACRNKFKVNARRSKGLGGRAGQYTWSVSPSTGITTSGTSTPVLKVTNPTPGTTYTVSLTLCNFMSQCDTDSHTVTQSASTAPDVEIETLVDVTQIKPSDRFDLIAKATLFKGCADDEVVFSWSFDQTSVTVNTDYQTRATYTIEPYVLPAPDTIVATVRASLANNTGVYSEANITITTQLSELEAIIDGAEVQTVGVGSGDVELDATVSVDPDALTGDTTYEWTCEVETTTGSETCLDQVGEVIPNATQKTSGIISLSSADLETDTNYVFKAVVSKKSYGTARFSTATVTVEATAGDPPKIKLDLVNDERGKYSVDDIVTIAAKVKSSTTPTLTWEALSETGLGYIDLTDSSNIAQQESPRLLDASTNTYLSFFSINRGVLDRGTQYRVLCQVTDASGQTAHAKIAFYIYNGVTSCQVSVDGGNYTELDALSGETDSCYTDTDGYPLTYTFYVAKDSSSTQLERLTKPSSDSQLSLTYGPRAYLNAGNIFVTKVCARKGGCGTFVSTTVTVSTVTASSVATKKTQVMETANDLKKSGDPVAGMLFLKTFVQISLGKARRKRSADPVTPEVNALVLDYVNNTLQTTYASQEVVDTIMDVVGALPLDSMSSADLQRMKELYETIVAAYTGSSAPSMASDLVAQLKQFSDYLVNTREFSSSETSSLDAAVGPASRKQLTFGSKSEMNAGSGTLTYTVGQLSSSQESKSSGSSIGVSFGTSLTNTYSSWTCGSSTCFGVGIEMNHYDTDRDPYSSSSTANNASRAAAVFDLKLFNQDSGDNLNVTGLSDPVTLSFSLTRSTGASTYVCKYWKEDSQEWSTDGVTTRVQTGTTVECRATHLTSFTVFSEVSVVLLTSADADATLNSDTSGSDKTAMIGGIVGGVVAAVFVIALVVILAMYLNKKHKMGETRGLTRSRRHRVGSAEHGTSRSNTPVDNDVEEDLAVRPTTVGQITVGARLGSADSTVRGMTPRGVTHRPATSLQITVSPLPASPTEYRLDIGDPAPSASC